MSNIHFGQIIPESFKIKLGKSYGRAKATNPHFETDLNPKAEANVFAKEIDDNTFEARYLPGDTPAITVTCVDKGDDTFEIKDNGPERGEGGMADEHRDELHQDTLNLRNAIKHNVHLANPPISIAGELGEG